MLGTRIASAAVIAAVVIAALLYLGPLGWAFFTAGVLAVAGWEWAGFARLPAAGRLAAAVLVGVACLGAAGWGGLLEGAPVAGRSSVFYAASLVFWVVAGTAWLARNPAHPGRTLVLAAGFVALVPAYLAVLELRLRGVAVFLLVGGIVWTADVAAYFAGRALGRRRLAPTISPGKTWEGVAGALLAVALYVMIVAGTFAAAAGITIPVRAMVVAGLVLAAFSIQGDLFESALKRQAGLKDSGRILPGHGGVLDRIDALIPVLPIAMLGLLFLGPTR